jgi:two-component system NtrC family response regulator
MTERRLLIIEDDPGIQSQMRWVFDDAEVFVASNATEADAIIRKEVPQVITLDLGLPPDPGGASEGFALLEQIGVLLPRCKVIVITGREDRANALQSIACGADDFYQKPIDSKTLRFVVDRAFRLCELEEENQRLVEAGVQAPLDGLITNCPQMLEICRVLERVAPTDVGLLVLGATGTGKEVLASAAHKLSNRSDGPLVIINCGAIPENLLESELFGHEKGAFTGALSRKIGRIEAANGGTLFLDEIGDMPLGLQVKILRFLQERTIDRVGGKESIEVDVRVIAATHRSLEQMIADGEFREDLYFRLSEITLTLPPLGERAGDAVLLANSFVQKFSPEGSLRLSDDAKMAIDAWNWPGNIRELVNRIKRACVMAEGSVITPQDLELSSGEQTLTTADLGGLNLKEVRATAERQAIRRALQHSDGNVSKASRVLGVSRPTLYNLLDKYTIQVNHG